jgi:WD40 repeat protein
VHQNHLQVWSVVTGLLLATARGHTGEISDLSLSADGSMVASGATDADVRVWSLQVIRSIAFMLPFVFPGILMHLVYCHAS